MNNTTTATDGTAKSVRRRGVFRLHEEILNRIINVPDGQRIIGFRADPLRLSIDVCVEGEGLPECPPGAEPYVVNADPYLNLTWPAARWATRGCELAEMLTELAKKFPDDSQTAVSIRKVLDGSLDPRVTYSTAPQTVERS